MPCTLTGSLEGDRELSYSEANKNVTKLTDMLCKTLSFVEKMHFNVRINLGPEINRWWVKHKEIDRQRLKRENEAEKQENKKKALAKLTKADKIALGLEK